jgi:hypothetical protein
VPNVKPVLFNVLVERKEEINIKKNHMDEGTGDDI